MIYAKINKYDTAFGSKQFTDQGEREGKDTNNYSTN